MHEHQRLLCTLAVAAGALTALPHVAAADSIVYADGGEIWSARPDGSGKVQLTTGGSWHSPTQADDGTLAAVQGTGPIVVMARDGRPLRTITTPGAKSGDGGTFAPRPVDLSFSPDGSKIAYAYVANSCPVASSCGTIQRSTFYTRADVTEATPHSVWGNQFSVSDPEWVTNDRALVFGGYGSQVSIDDLGPGDYSQVPWMTPNADQGDGELSRDGKRLVTTFFYGDNTLIAWFAVNGDAKQGPPPADPAVACETTEGDAKHADPSFSPDGTATAFESKEGIQILRFTEMAPGNCATTGPSTTLAATGSQPDWGPADPPAARYASPGGPAGPGGQPGPGGGTGGGGSGAPGGGVPQAAVAVKAGGNKKQRFVRTLRVTCSAPVVVPCTATVTVKLGKRTLTTSATLTTKPGRATALRPRFSRKDATAIRTALARKGTLKANVLVAAGGPAARRTITLTR